MRRIAVDSFKFNVPRRGITQFLEEEEKKKQQQQFEDEVSFHTQNKVNTDQKYVTEFDQDKSFLDKTGDFVMDVLSIPERLDKAIGIHGTRQKAIKMLTGGLSEDHIIAALAGEMIVPDSFDLITLGLGYIPRRVLTKGPKAIKMFLKAKKSRLPKSALKGVDDVAPAGSKFASDLDYDEMVTGVTKMAEATGRNVDEALVESGLLNKLDPEPDDLADAIKKQDEELLNMQQQQANVVPGLDPTKAQQLPMPLTQKLDELTQRFSRYTQAVGNSFTFDYKEFRKAISGAGADAQKAARAFLELFQTPLNETLKASGRVASGTNFGQLKKGAALQLKEAYYDLADVMGLARPIDINVHHIAPLKGVMGIFDGLEMGSPLHQAVIQRITKNAKGIGGMRENLTALIGMATEKDTPHYLAHVFLTEFLGESGEKFFTDTVLAGMRKNNLYRLKKAEQLGKIIAESERIARQAQKVFDATMRSNNIYSAERIIEIMSQLSNRGYLRSMGQKYQFQGLNRIIKDIADIGTDFGSTVFADIDLIEAIGKNDRATIDTFKTIVRLAKEGRTPSARTINKALGIKKGQKSIFQLPEMEGYRQEIFVQEFKKLAERLDLQREKRFLVDPFFQGPRVGSGADIADIIDDDVFIPRQ